MEKCEILCKHLIHNYYKVPGWQSNFISSKTTVFGINVQLKTGIFMYHFRLKYNKYIAHIQHFNQVIVTYNYICEPYLEKKIPMPFAAFVPQCL